MTQGILLINLGTPDHPTKKAIRRYLAEFLADARVITLPWLWRYLLLYLFILPFRTSRTLHAYKEIWTPHGSPLGIKSRHLSQAVQEILGEQFRVAIGMRYGQPSIAQALTELADCTSLHVVPLYPQYSSAATGSALEKFLELISKQINIPNLTIIREFYQHPSFIKAQATVIAPYLKNHDFLLLSYHGLPVSHLQDGGCQSPCNFDCNQQASTCYRAQCFYTSKFIGLELGLPTTQYATAFQSRLGRTPWIQPYTDECLIQLQQRGIKRLAVACPSFVTDCLETLEEIGLRAREQWLQLGGEELTLVPCLNTHPLWIQAIVDMVSA